MPYAKLEEDSRWFTDKMLENIFAVCFIEAVNAVLWESGDHQAIKFKISKYVKENPFGDVLPETQRRFPVVVPVHSYISSGTWEGTLERIKEAFFRKLPSDPKERYREDVESFFRNIKTFGNM